MHRRLTLVLAGVTALVVAGAGWALGRSGSDEAAPTTSLTTSSSRERPLTGTPGAPGVGDPYFPMLGNGGYDVEHYTLDLTWRADVGALDGVATIVATSTQDLSRFDLDLSGMEVRSVTVDGTRATFHRSDAELEITPGAAIATGRGFTTIVTYTGAPEPVHLGTRLFATGWQTRGREAFVLSEPGGASTFFPVNDHPTDKATYTLRVTAPSDQVVAANGLLVATDDIGHGTQAWTYEASDAMASYLVQIAIGDFELVDAGTVDGVVLRHAFHRTLATDARVATERTADMIRVLAGVYGPFPFEAYGVLAVDEGLGVALETQTLTLIGSDLASAGRGADPILVHELAHQWVGDAVSVESWKDIWLNEGFATYSQWLYEERTGGRSAAQVARQYQGVGAFDAPPGDPGREELFGPSVYIRGGMTLQALRERIGDGDFFTLLRTWVDEHRGGAVSTADLIALAERVSGDDLDALFEEWLGTGPLPVL